VILAASLDRTSDFAIADLRRQARQMPLYLVDRVCHENPIVRSSHARIDTIRRTLLDHNNVRELWRDSDIYYPIFTLFEAGDDASAVDLLLRRLEIQLGIRPLSGLRTLPPATYRLLSLTGQVWAANAHSVLPLHNVSTRVPGCAATVYLPRPGLFHDVLPVERYPEAAADNARDDVLVAKLTAACEMLAELEPDVYADLQDLISTIVLTPSGHQAACFDSFRQTWSYNLRLRYFGGIFIDAAHVDAFAVAEGVMHEYLHQRLWQWWELEHPDGLPPPQATLTSPMTGVVRPTYVMVQALLIYVAVHALHARALSRGRHYPVTPWVHARVAHLTDGIPRLLTALRAVVPRGSTTDLLLDVGSDIFDAHQAAHDTCARDVRREA
jgi:hypothetical protein